MKAYATMLLALTACGGGGSQATPDGSSTDGGVAIDGSARLDGATADAPIVPQMITISGTAKEEGLGTSTPTPGVMISLYKQSNETTPLATMVTDGQGKYSFTVATNGAVLDAFIKATLSGHADNYAYPTSAFQADATLDASLITTANFTTLKTNATQTAGKGLIVAELVNAAGAAVQGATVTSLPASTYRYSGLFGLPSSTTSTAADGAAFFINVPPGPVTLSAALAGATFKSHTIGAHADAFTTTTITE